MIKETTHLSTIISYTFITILIVAFMIYVGWQARFLLIGPQIALVDEPETVQTTRTIALSGHTSNITGITINDRPMP